MKKIIQKDYIMGMTLFFLMLQPILDIKMFYSFELFGMTIPTMIRLLFLAFLFLLYLLDKKKFKFLIIYGITFCLYSIFHLINASYNYINVSSNYSIGSEIIYLIRLLLPMLFIIFSYNYKFEFSKINKLFYSLALVFAIIMLATNIFGIAYPAYPFVDNIVGNIFSWPFLSHKTYYYYDVATKGLFSYANPLSSLFCLILPILLYSFYKQFNIKKFIIIILFLISMLMVGTRTASYFSIIILFMMLIIYIFLSCVFKKFTFDKKVFIYNIILIVIIIPIFLVGPIHFATDRMTSEDQMSYVEKNKLLEKIDAYKEKLNSDLTDDERLEIEKFIIDNHSYFSVKTGLAPDAYLYDDYLQFWLDYLPISYKNSNGSREFELYLFNHIYEHNNNIYDTFVGYGYSQNFNNGLVLEKDGIYQFYTLGIIGLLLFIVPYFIILIYSIIKILMDFKNKADLENITYVFIIGMLLTLALLAGNLFDFFIVNIFLSFICGQVLYNVKNS